MKLKLFQKYLQEQDIDLAFLITPDINLTYFTQVKPSFAFLLIKSSSARLYQTKLDEKYDEHHYLPGITVQYLQKKWEDKLKDKKVKKIGVNKSALTLAYSEKLKKIFPQVRFVDVGLKLQELRVQKTAPEVKLIKSACQITSTVFQELLEELSLKRKILHTEKEVVSFIDNHLREKGAEPAFPTIVAMGQNAAIPHYNSANSKLKQGFLLLDFGANYHNYCSDFSRTLFLGIPNQEEKERYQLLLSAQKTTISNLTENKLFSEVDCFCRRQLGRYSSYFIHSLGHGVGLEVHEAPSFLAENKPKIMSGQVFTIEPGLYFPQKYGLRIEDTILFDGKIKVLTTAEKERIDIPL